MQWCFDINRLPREVFFFFYEGRSQHVKMPCHSSDRQKRNHEVIQSGNTLIWPTQQPKTHTHTHTQCGKNTEKKNDKIGTDLTASILLSIEWMCSCWYEHNYCSMYSVSAFKSEAANLHSILRLIQSIQSSVWSTFAFKAHSCTRTCSVVRDIPLGHTKHDGFRNISRIFCLRFIVGVIFLWKCERMRAVPD